MAANLRPLFLLPCWYLSIYRTSLLKPVSCLGWRDLAVKRFFLRKNRSINIYVHINCNVLQCLSFFLSTYNSLNSSSHCIISHSHSFILQLLLTHIVWPNRTRLCLFHLLTSLAKRQCSLAFIWVRCVHPLGLLQFSEPCRGKSGN